MDVNMTINMIMQYASYLLIAIGAMAFLVSAITQLIKELPMIKEIPTAVVVFVLALVLCPVSFLALMAWMSQPVEWYMIFACMLSAFIVALVALDGWERVKSIWDRTKYKE